MSPSTRRESAHATIQGKLRLRFVTVPVPIHDANIQDQCESIAPLPRARRLPVVLTAPLGGLAALRGASVCELDGVDGSGLGVHLLEFDLENFVSGDFAQSGIACPPSVARSVRKRQAEFLFGRLAARLALSGQFPAAAVDEVAIGATREPVWPVDAIGSISHCGGLAAATVERRNPRSGIGIDIERIATGDACKALLATVVDEQEIALLRGLAWDAWSLEMLLTLVFSAKESLFKGAFGAVGRYFDFDAAQLRSVDLEARRIRLVLTGPLCAQFVHGQHIDIGFELLDADLVLTHFVW